MEWSLNVESEVFVEFSFLWIFWVFVNIDDFPFLSKFLSICSLVPDTDSGVISVNSVLDIKYLTVVVVLDSSILVFPELPPS
jgi:hypothetical protein